MTAEKSLRDRLAEHFDIGELKFFPVAVSRDKKSAKVGSYIDARAVMDRLDDVVGPDGWMSEYRVVDENTKAVECRLSLLIEGKWVTKGDVGYPNEGKDADNPDKEPYKAAYSDALKRAAVQYGIGRYIYSLALERDWLAIDEWGKFTEQPRLKGDRSPRPAQQPAAAPQAAPAQAPRQQAAAEPVDQFGDFKNDAGKGDVGIFRKFVEDQGFGWRDLGLVVPSEYGTVGEWLSRHRDKTLMDLFRLMVEAKKKKEEETREPVAVS